MQMQVGGEGGAVAGGWRGTEGGAVAGGWRGTEGGAVAVTALESLEKLGWRFCCFAVPKWRTFPCCSNVLVIFKSQICFCLTARLCNTVEPI